MKIIIVGGVAAGASAATRARRLSEEAEIVVFEKGKDVSFANCGLPYHIGEIIPQREKLLVTTAAKLEERFRLDVRTQQEVTSIDPLMKLVTVRNHKDGTIYSENYDKLILAPGAAPIRPQITGWDLPGVFTLRNLQDTDRIKQAVDGGIQDVVIVGGGFIGLELTENFLHRGLSVTLFDRNAQLLSPFDPEMVRPLHQYLLHKRVQIHLQETLQAIQQDGDKLTLQTDKGQQLQADMVILGIGVSPENQLAKLAGVKTGPRGGIIVNEFLETSVADIYAAGDVVETAEAQTGERTQIPLAGPANRQGRIAAENALGGHSRYRGTQGTAILGFFDQTIAMTGLSEKSLLRQGRDYRKVYIHPAHHAGYYPGARPMTLKLLFDPKGGKILGAQGVGSEGVDKRIDAISMAIQGKLTVYDLEEAELCYAPQFGSAKDPVNMLGFVAAGWLRGHHPQISWEQVKANLQGRLLLDVRTQAEYDQGHIPGAKLIPIDELRQRLGELHKDQPLVVYCQVGQRGYNATRILMEHGFQAVNLSGGYKSYLLLD